MKSRILKAINEGINNALILFGGEGPILKKSSDDSELGRQYLWIENNTVDLGLPSGTRWATCNIGAEKPTDYGLYFLWGDPIGYTEDNIESSNKKFKEFDYKWYDISENLYIKYNEIDNQTELDLEDDPAYEYSNSMLVSPTVELCKELKNCCDWSWSTINGINGYRVLSKVNDNYIFLPASGYCAGRSINSRNSRGYYWSRSLNFNIMFAYSIYFHLPSVNPANFYSRYSGFTVRGVLR